MAERLRKGTDRCGSPGSVYALEDLLTNEYVEDPEARGTLLDTETEAQPRTIIYAVNEHFQIHVAIDGDRTLPDAVKHETLFHNKSVRAAGELGFKAGVIVHVNDHSGSYSTGGSIQTDARFVEAVLVALDGISAPLHPNERERLKREAGL